MPLAPGTRLGSYEIVSLLRTGGMGEVYVAEDAKLERKVALKVLPPEMAESPERRKRFEREAKTIAALNHPNIVHVYSVEGAQGIHFITMELVLGKTVSRRSPLRRSRATPRSRTGSTAALEAVRENLTRPNGFVSPREASPRADVAIRKAPELDDTLTRRRITTASRIPVCRWGLVADRPDC